MRSDYVTSFSQKHQIPSLSACEAASFSLAAMLGSCKSTRVCCAAVHNMKLSRKRQGRNHPM